MAHSPAPPLPRSCSACRTCPLPQPRRKSGQDARLPCGAVDRVPDPCVQVQHCIQGVADAMQAGADGRARTLAQTAFRLAARIEEKPRLSA